MSPSLLEERYRLALRLLPADYRATWAEDMVDTFLERAHAATPDDPEGVDNGRPSLAELGSLVGLAVRLRIGGADAPARPRLLGDAVRLAGLIGLLYHAGLAVGGLLITAWLSAGLAGPLPADAGPYPTRWLLVTNWLGLLWLVGLLIVLFGQSRYAWVPAAVALVVSAAVLVVSATNDGPLSATSLTMLGVSGATGLALGSYRRSAARPGRPGWWLVALAVAAVGEAVTALVSIAAATGPDGPTDPGPWPMVDWLTPWCVALVVAAVVLLSPRSGRSGRTERSEPAVRSAGPPALALVALGLLAVRTASAVDLTGFAGGGPGRPLMVAVLAVQIALVLAVGVAAAVRTVRAWRRLPANQY